MRHCLEDTQKLKWGRETSETKGMNSSKKLVPGAMKNDRVPKVNQSRLCAGIVLWRRQKLRKPGLEKRRKTWMLLQALHERSKKNERAEKKSREVGLPGGLLLDPQWGEQSRN